MVDASRLDFAALEPEAIVDVLAARRWIASNALEKVGEGFVEIAQRLLLAGLRNSSDPVKSGAKHRQLARLRDVIKRAPGLSLKLTPGVPPLLKRKIVDEAADAGELPEQSFLSGGRIELVAKSAKDHSAIIAVGLTERNVSDNADIRKGRHVVYPLNSNLVFVTK